MTMAEKILAQRKKEGLSQEELAEKLGVSRQAISRWEMGAAFPDAPNILGLSRLFGVTTDYLLYDEYETVQAPHETACPIENAPLYMGAVFAGAVALSAAVLVFQFINAAYYQSEVLCLVGTMLSVLLAGAFEMMYRVLGPQDPAGRTKRARFYTAAVWMGTYFPLRLVLTYAAYSYPRPYSSFVFDGLVLLAWLAVGCETMAHFWRDLK